MQTLYIVGTPIGNLGDITFRAAETLRDVAYIVAEDTRQAKKLLSHLGIHKPVISFHAHTSDKRLEEVLSLFKEHSLAYVVDAGTPGISDPGGRFISAVGKRYGKDVAIVPIPGVSALSTLLSVVDVPVHEFFFLGFLPKKKGRNKALNSIAASPYPVVFFESPYRIGKTLRDLALLGQFYVVVGRELTKKFETVYRGNIAEVLAKLRDAKTMRGEFTVFCMNKE